MTDISFSSPVYFPLDQDISTFHIQAVKYA